jgi:hypothetical protein
MEEKKCVEHPRMLCQNCGGICSPEDQVCLVCGSRDLVALPEKAFGLRPENLRKSRPSAKGEPELPFGMKKTTGESQ